MKLAGFRITGRHALIVGHDLLATLLAILAALFVRFDANGIFDRVNLLAVILPLFLVYAGFIFYVSGLSRSKWRFTSLPDLSQILRVSTVLSLSLLVLDYVLFAPNVYGGYFFGKVTIFLYWVLQIFFLGGLRLIYRQFRDTRSRQRRRQQGAVPSLILGVAADAEVLLRAIESGAVKKITPVAILSPSRSDQGHSVRGVMVVGKLENLENVVLELRARNIDATQLVLTPSALLPERKPENILMAARKLGLVTNRVPSLEGGSERVALAPLDVEDLLLRPSVKVDYDRLEQFIAGKSVAVTGGGGSIGAEICRRLAALRASRLLILENSEPALHAIVEQLRIDEPDTRIDGRIGDIRDRDRMFRLLQDFKPDLIFHAAALKHVPILEKDSGEAVKTNLFGTINVADAAVDVGARAMVMISTDKAIEPVSVLGRTKRLAEMYCQALDRNLRANEKAKSTRIVSVRFGNVLASNGSVVPKFRAQIEAGGPVTVTHPDMVRYFMTIREACDLVVVSASHAASDQSSAARVYVLNMGQQVKIVTLAEHLIRLSGLEPGVDIKIEFTGMRPGERLQEQVFEREERHSEIGIDGVVAAEPNCPPLVVLHQWIGELRTALSEDDMDTLLAVLHDRVPNVGNCQTDLQPNMQPNEAIV